MNQKPSKPIPPGLVAGLIVALCLLFIWYFVLPALSGSRKSLVISVVNNLSQIELAKEMWASDRGATGALQVSAQDLAIYMGQPAGSSNLVKPVMGERYIINPFGVAPEAVLAHDSGRWPSGTVIRLHSRPTLLLPNEQGRANGRQPSSSLTNPAPAAAASRRSP
jgi:hypothetical protein